MADATRDSFLIPNTLGTLGFEESSVGPGTVTRILHEDSVGAFAFFEASGGFPGSDAQDFFTFTASGVNSVKVTVNTLSDGSYANLLWLVPTSGVSKVEGDIVGTWSSGSHRSSFFNDVVEGAGGDIFDGYQDGLFTTGVDLSDATQSRNETFSAVWTLDGSTVRFDMSATQLDGDLPNRNGPVFLSASEVPYSFELTPQDRSYSDTIANGLLFKDSAPYAETHAGRDTIDTYSVSGSRSAYTISEGPDGTIQIVEERFPSLGDTLVDIERIQFEDGYLAFDTDGHAGQIYRLYQAAFDRDPDLGGLGHWIDSIDSGGFDLVGVAEEFLISQEFQDRFGTEETLDDKGFLTLLYNNVLDRDPDQPGFDFWSAQQDNGLSRAEILRYFSESDENYANVAPEIDAGIFYL